MVIIDTMKIEWKYIAVFIIFIVIIILGLYAVNYNMCKFLGLLK